MRLCWQILKISCLLQLLQKSQFGKKNNKNIIVKILLRPSSNHGDLALNLIHFMKPLRYFFKRPPWIYLWLLASTHATDATAKTANRPPCDSQATWSQFAQCEAGITNPTFICFIFIKATDFYIAVLKFTTTCTAIVIKYDVSKNWYIYICK